MENEAKLLSFIVYYTAISNTVVINSCNRMCKKEWTTIDHERTNSHFSCGRGSRSWESNDRMSPTKPRIQGPRSTRVWLDVTHGKDLKGMVDSKRLWLDLPFPSLPFSLWSRGFGSHTWIPEGLMPLYLNWMTVRRVNPPWTETISDQSCLHLYEKEDRDRDRDWNQDGRVNKGWKTVE